jgi:hypothetical protein
MSTASQTTLDRALAYLDEAVRFAVEDTDEPRAQVLVVGRSRLVAVGWDRERFAKVLHEAGFTPQRVTVALRSVEHPELPALRKQTATALRLTGATRLADNIERRERCEDVKVGGQLIAYQIAKGFGTKEHDDAMVQLQRTADALNYRATFDNAVAKTIERARRPT